METAPSTPPKKRKTPTEKQIEALGKLDDDALVAEALEALHALNRRAKEIRDRRNVYRRATFAKHLASDLDEIYAIKDKFLEAMVLAERAMVFTFTVVEETNERTCCVCGRAWFGGSWCYQCDDDTGVAEEEESDWYVIDCGEGYRFHQPAVSEAVAVKAQPTEPHDPTQPQREVPKVGFTLAAQRQCVRLATERLHAVVPQAPLDAPGAVLQAHASQAGGES